MTRRLRLSLHTHLCGLSLALDNSLLRELGFFPAWLHGLADTCGSFQPSLLKDFNITGWGSAEKAEKRTCFFLAGLGSLDGIHLACVIGREHGVSVVGVGNRGAVYGVGWVGAGRVAFPCWSRSGGGYQGASLFFPPFPFSLIRFGPWDKTLHSTHTHNGWDCKRSGIRRWAVWVGMLGVVGFLFGRGWSGLVWSGSSFSFGTVTLILYTSHHHMTAHRHYTALHPPH